MRQSYERIPTAGNPRITEGWALIEAARAMAEALQSGEPSDLETRRQMREALRRNWRLWTIFQADLSAGRSDAPPEVRRNMMALCQFIDQRTVEALANPLPDILAVLIDINRNIAAGLLQVEQPTPTPFRFDADQAAKRPGISFSACV